MKLCFFKFLNRVGHIKLKVCNVLSKREKHVAYLQNLGCHQEISVNQHDTPLEHIF